MIETGIIVSTNARIRCVVLSDAIFLIYNWLSLIKYYFRQRRYERKVFYLPMTNALLLITNLFNNKPYCITVFLLN